MAPKSWASDDQTAWMKDRLGDYITRQAEGKLHLFWPSMFEAWFRKYPEQVALGLPLPNDPGARPLTNDELATLGARIQAKRKQLETWYRYRRKRTASSTAVQTSASTTMMKMFTDKGTRRRRPHKPTELFSQRNKTVMDEALALEGYNEITEASLRDQGDSEDEHDERDDTAAGRRKRVKSARMRMWTQVATAKYAEAPEEERKIIESLIEKEKEEMRAEDLATERSAKTASSRTPEEFQQGVDQLEAVFKEVHTAAHELAGWVGMSLIGGPNPRMGGEFSLKVICFGKTAAGNDFEDVCVDFDKNVQEPFEAFLRTVFTAQQAKARALPERSSSPAPEGRIEREMEGAMPVSTPAPVPAKAKKRVAKPRKQNPVPAKTTAIPGEPTISSTPSGTTIPNDSLAALNRADNPFSCDPNSVSDANEEDEPMDYDPLHDGEPVDDEQPIRGDASLRDEELGGSWDSFLETSFNPWPLGMTPPLSPGSAAAIARRERGGVAAAGTMMIDPALMGLATPSPTQPTSKTPSTGAWKRSELFAAFQGSSTPPALPASRAPSVPLLRSQSLGTPPGFASRTARAMAQLVVPRSSSVAPNGGPTTTTTLPAASTTTTTLPAASTTTTTLPAASNTTTTLPAASTTTTTLPAASTSATTPGSASTVATTSPATVLPTLTPTMTVPASGTRPSTPTFASTVATTSPTTALPTATTTMTVRASSVSPTPTSTSSGTATMTTVFPAASTSPMTPTSASIVTTSSPTTATVAPATFGRAPRFVLPQSRPAARAPAAPGAPRPKPVPKSATTVQQRAAKEAGAKEAEKLDAVKGAAKKRGRPKKNVSEEAAPEPTTNTGSTSGSRRPNTWSARDELRKYYELNTALQPTPPEALPPPREAGAIQLLPNPNGATPSVLLPRTRKPAKLADGTEVQRQVKGTRRPVNPHAATEEKLLARSAAAKAKVGGGTKRKAAAQENAAGPKQKRRRN